MTLNEKELAELREAFRGEINVDQDDPLSPIDIWNFKNLNGDSCLHIAVSRDQLRIVELLIKGGIEVNSIGAMGRNALHCANRRGNHKMIQLLIESDVKRSIEDDFGQLS